MRNTSGITPKIQARGGAHLGIHRSHRLPQVGTSLRARLNQRSVSSVVQGSSAVSRTGAVCVDEVIIYVNSITTEVITYRNSITLTETETERDEQ